MRADRFSSRTSEINGWAVRIESVRLGEQYNATVRSVDPGASIARAEAATREEAEREAIEKAAERLGQTRIFR